MLDDGLPVTTVLADRSCATLQIAEERGAAPELIDRTPFGGFGPAFDRLGYTVSVAATLVAHQVDLVAMAGFGTVLAEPIHQGFPGRILNTHPSLLPAFPGWHAVRDALAAGATETGCTVHLATSKWTRARFWPSRQFPCTLAIPRRRCTSGSSSVERSLYPARCAWALREIEEGREIDPRRSSTAPRFADGERRGPAAARSRGEAAKKRTLHAWRMATADLRPHAEAS